MVFGTCGISGFFRKTKERKPKTWDIEVKKMNSQIDFPAHRRSKAESNKGIDVYNDFWSPPRNSSLPKEGISKPLKKGVSRTSDATKNKGLVILEKTVHDHQRSLSQGNIYKFPQNLKDIDQGIKERPKNNVLGHGRCHYGHGNIIRRASIDVQSNSQSISATANESMMPNRLISQSSSFRESVEGLNNMGNTEYRRASFSGAISFYDKAIALCPQNAACHNNKAAALIGLGRLTEAMEECLQAIKCDPSCSRAHHRLGIIYTRFGQVDDARWHFKLSKNNIDSKTTQSLLDIEAHYTNTKKARKVKDWHGVLTESTLCIEAGADASNKVISLKAEALLKLQRAKEAFELVNTARHSKDDRHKKDCKGTAYLLVIETQISLYFGRFEEGVLIAWKAVDLDSTRKSLKWLRKARGAADARKAGNDLFKEGKYLEACIKYGDGLQYLPTNSVLLCNRAACRSKLEQWEKAIDDCNAALRERPNYNKALLRRAHSYAKDQLGHWEKSLWDYDLLSKELPGDEFIANSIRQVQMELKDQDGRSSLQLTRL